MKYAGRNFFCSMPWLEMFSRCEGLCERGTVNSTMGEVFAVPAWSGFRDGSAAIRVAVLRAIR